MKKLRIITVAVLVAIMLLIVVLPTNAAFEGVTVKVTSNVGNGTEVNPGDEILYNINVRNNSEYDYLATIIALDAPEQTEIINIESDNPFEYDSKDFNNEEAWYDCIPFVANSEANIKVTVKVKEDATGEIKFAHLAENEISSEDAKGALGLVVFSMDATEEDFNNFENLELDDSASIEEIREIMGENATVDVIKQAQTNPIKVEETVEEPVEEETKAEEPVEEVKTEEKKEETTKPSKLPKTGMEYNVCALIAGIVMLAVGIKLIK